MHILYIQQILNFPEASGNCRTYEMAKGFVQAGHQVTLLTSSATFPSESFEEIPQSFPCIIQREGINLLVIAGSYSHFMGFFKRIIAFLLFWIRAQKAGKSVSGVDRVLAYTPPLTVGFLGLRLARFHKAPLALEVADVWPDVPIGMNIIRNPILAHILRRFAKHLYHKAELLLPYSEGMKAQLLSYRLPQENIQVLHNGANLSEWPYSSPSLRTGERIRLVYAGTLGQANEVKQLIDAAALLDSWDLPPYQLIIIGEGNREAFVKEYAQLSNVPQVIFYPWMKRVQLRSWFASAHIGVISFAPYPVLEANGATKFFDYLANGLPVVLNYQGWQAEYLRTYNCGLSSPQGDLEAFCRNIKQLMKSPSIRNEMSQNARLLVKAKFDRKLLFSNTIRCLEELGGPKFIQEEKSEIGK